MSDLKSIPDLKRTYTAEGVEIRTFQPQLTPGTRKPDPMKPPPFAASKPRPAGEWPESKTTVSGNRKK